MNPSIPQCKNCWKWGHTALLCRIQRAKYVKCNSLYKSENYYQFGWCCKANDKINLSYLKTKKYELCLHVFKCSNCRGDHQTDSNLCCQVYKWQTQFFFILLFIFILFLIYFLFSIFRTTRVRGDQSRCHISHNLMAQSQDRSQDLGEFSRRFKNK